MAEPQDLKASGDAELIRLAKSGEAVAFEELYLRYRDWAFSLAFRFTRNEHDANDALQEAFLGFFSRIESFELRCQLKTFLYTVVKNACADLARKRAARPEQPLNAASEAEEAAKPGKDLAAEREQLLYWTSRLPEAQREVVLLRFGDGLELNEIAEALDVPLGTVKSRLHKALESLRERVRPA